MNKPKKIEISPRVRVLTINDLKAAGFGSDTTIYRRMAQGKFPQSIKVGGTTVWRESTIIEFLEKQQASK